MSDRSVPSLFGNHDGSPTAPPFAEFRGAAREPAPGAAEPPRPVADPAWDEAFLRVEGYLRSYGLESHVLLNHLVAAIIQEARERSAAGDARHPVAVSIDVANARIAAWFSRAGNEIDWASERGCAQCRLALIIADLPGRWPTIFLGPEPFPEELTSAIASFQILSGPELRLSGMAPEPLEFGLLEPRDPHLPPRRIWFPAKAMAYWFLIFGFFGIAWAASH